MSATSRHLAKSSFFAEQFLRDMHVANTATGPAKSTHDKGGVLDLILMSEGIGVDKVDFDVGLGGNDLACVTIVARIRHAKAPHQKWRWTNSWEANGDDYMGEFDEPLAAVHKWYGQRLDRVSSNSEGNTLVNEVSLLLGVISQGVL